MKEEKKTKQKKVEECNKCEEYLAGWQREKADFENFRKQQGMVLQNAQAKAAEECIKELLPVIDTFEAALNSTPKDLEDHEWVKGVMFVKKQFEDFLEQMAITPIDTTIPFDERFHEAVKLEGDPEALELHITDVVKKGYKINNRVLRPAQVIVNTNTNHQSSDHE